MAAKGVVDFLRPGVLIITPAIATTSSSRRRHARISGSKNIAGIVLTNDILPDPRLLELLAQTTIPVIGTEESFTIASKIHDMT